MCCRDAAWSAQPLASAGVAKALRDASLVARALQSGGPTYDRLQTTEFLFYPHHFLESRALPLIEFRLHRLA